MKNALFVVVLLLAPSLSRAEQVSLFETTYPHGNHVDYQVSRERLLASPNWTPDKGDPPLSISAAVRAAQKHVKAQAPLDLQATGITLASCLAPDRSYRWYYWIDLLDKTKLAAPEPPSMSHVV